MFLRRNTESNIQYLIHNKVLFSLSLLMRIFSMNLKIKRLLCIVLSVMTIASLVVIPTGITAAEKVIYVSPTGNDSGNGSLSSYLRKCIL